VGDTASHTLQEIGQSSFFLLLHSKRVLLDMFPYSLRHTQLRRLRRHRRRRPWRRGSLPLLNFGRPAAISRPSTQQRTPLPSVSANTSYAWPDKGSYYNNTFWTFLGTKATVSLIS